MSDTYCAGTVSPTIKVSKFDLSLLMGMINECDEEDSDRFFETAGIDIDHDGINLSYDIVEECDDVFSLYLYFRDGYDTVDIDVLRWLTKKADMNHVSVEWANTDSSLRMGSQGGGAMLIFADGRLKTTSSHQWLETAVIEEQDRLKHEWLRIKHRLSRAQYSAAMSIKNGDWSAEVVAEKFQKRTLDSLVNWGVLVLIRDNDPKHGYVYKVSRDALLWWKLCV